MFNQVKTSKDQLILMPRMMSNDSRITKEEGFEESYKNSDDGFNLYSRKKKPEMRHSPSSSENSMDSL